MVITIFFIVMGFAVLIGAFIYTRKKNSLQQHRSLDKKVRKQKKNLKNLWGIEAIEGTSIIVDNAHSVIIEIGGVDYYLLDDEEQDRIDNALENIARTFKYPSQFFSTTIHIDTSKAIEDIRKNIENQNEKIKNYGKKIIEHLQGIMDRKDIYVRKNYVIVTSYDNSKMADIDLKEFYDSFKYNLLNQNIFCRLLKEDEILELIHTELNKGSNEKIKDIIGKGGLELYVTGKRTI